MANDVSPVGNKAKFKTKLTKLLVHTLWQRNPSAVTFSFAGFEGIMKPVLSSKKRKGFGGL